MCGIAGFVSSVDTKLNLTKILISMTDALSERGPDSKGYYENKNKGYFLGHRRLSIIELSEKGKQPMYSPSKRYVITFNGEIYNHNIIRTKLKFKGLIISDDIEMKALSKNLIFNANLALSSGCNLVLYCGGNTKKSTKLLKELNTIDSFTVKKTRQLYRYLR